jgi:hypothetical protein
MTTERDNASHVLSQLQKMPIHELQFAKIYLFTSPDPCEVVRRLMDEVRWTKDFSETFFLAGSVIWNIPQLALYRWTVPHPLPHKKLPGVAGLVLSDYVPYPFSISVDIFSSSCNLTG